ncbi:hypothetical protein [Phytohabitans suffuscus]|uniref:Smu12A n=1 Tax=Phytohabitans suffuscus TaxID=624315 RepID=A0A6F8YJS7_9ACTN|nr:hypothetical protein [Phytohabitans suffuscus]BCB86362.1 hypothetical protein Psuf_036750 [Phytohabitans suffuscus]
MRDRTWAGSRQEPPPAADAAAWVTGAVPEGWFTEPPQIVIDRDEIVIVGRLPEPQLAGEASDADKAAAEAGRINQHREDTRDRRIRIAQQLERRYQRKVAWGAECGGTSVLFTNFSAPVMTRLRQPERQVLDTLVEAGVARSRSDALAWCVRLVGEHTNTWLDELREAMGAVADLRKRGPGTGEASAS